MYEVEGYRDKEGKVRHRYIRAVEKLDKTTCFNASLSIIFIAALFFLCNYKNVQKYNLQKGVNAECPLNDDVKTIWKRPGRPRSSQSIQCTPDCQKILLEKTVTET